MKSKRIFTPIGWFYPPGERPLDDLTVRYVQRRAESEIGRRLSKKELRDLIPALPSLSNVFALGEALKKLPRVKVTARRRAT